MMAKEKYSRNIKALKIASVAAAVTGVVYFMLSALAPQFLERLGGAFSSSIGTPSQPAIIAAAEKGGHYYRLGTLLKEELESSKNINMDVRVTAGTIENLELLRNRQADFAFIQGGVPESEMGGLDDLVAVATLGWQYVHIMVPADSPIKEFKDLQGHTVSLGPEKSGNAVLAKLVMAYFHPSANIKTIHTSIHNIHLDFRDGKMDAMFTVYDMHAPLLEELLDNGLYTLVPIPEAEAVAYIIPGCFPAEIPHSLYGKKRNIPPGNESPFKTLKVNTLLITRQEVSGPVVREFLRALFSPRFIKKSRLPHLNEENGRKVFDLPLHPEAQEFYRRSDPVTADKFEILSAFLALILFFAAIVGYVRTWGKKRLAAKRKKNIEHYFEKLLHYSIEMGKAKEIHQLEELLDDMMNMQRRAEKEWIEGKLDTEDMENLYSIYGIRCDNAFNRMSQIQLVKNRELFRQWCDLTKTGQSPTPDKNKKS